MKPLTANQLSIIHGEPRVFDLHLAACLGMSDPHKIRRTIERNRPELEMHGGVSVSDTKTLAAVSAPRAETSSKGGRPGRAYYLNEGQALVLCALSQTPKAAEIRKQIIDVFVAWRQGRTVPVKAHHRTPPSPAVRTFFSLEFTDDGLARVILNIPRDFALNIARMYLERSA